MGYRLYPPWCPDTGTGWNLIRGILVPCYNICEIKSELTVGPLNPSGPTGPMTPAAPWNTAFHNPGINLMHIIYQNSLMRTFHIWLMPLSIYLLTIDTRHSFHSLCSFYSLCTNKFNQAWLYVKPDRDIQLGHDNRPDLLCLPEVQELLLVHLYPKGGNY